MSLPKVLSEIETLRHALGGESLARFGDGELRLASGRGTAVTQVANKNLAAELRTVLKAPPKNCLVCIPDFHRGPKQENWSRYGKDYLGFYGPGPYGSAFISRPDSAPWIDTTEYWQMVSALWEGRFVVFVGGTDRSLRGKDFANASGACEIVAPRRDAYAEIDRIEKDVIAACATAEHDPVVILCLGPAATVLAARLAGKGIHALDLGHIGMFRRHAGAYRYTLDDLASPAYRAQLEAMHAKKGWGGDGKKHAAQTLAFARELDAGSILDYGCGRGALATALAESHLKIEGFDVGIPAKRVMPKPADIVVCTDVIEHVEPKKLDNVLRHICLLSAKGAHLVIATRAANAVLPDGKNAHLIVKEADFWLQKVKELDWSVQRSEVRGNHEVAIWLRK